MTLKDITKLERRQEMLEKRSRGQAGQALQNAQLFAEREACREGVEVLLDIARALASTMELKQVLKIIAQRTAQAVGAERCSITLWSEGRVVPVMSQFADGHADPGLWAKFKAMGPRPLDQVPAYGEAIRTKRPVMIEDTTSSSLSPADWLRASGARSALVVPLVHQDEVIGTLTLDQTKGPYAWHQEQIDLGMTIANQAALAVANARLFEATERRRRAAESLAEVGRLISESLDPEQVGQRIVDSVLSLLDVQAASLYRLEPESEDLVMFTASGEPWSTLGRKLVVPKGYGIAGLAVLERQALGTPDLLADPRIRLTPELRARVEQAACGAVLALPLLVKDRVIGALGVGDRSGRVFTGEEVRLAEAFADQAALALEKSRVYRQAEERAQKLTTLSTLTRLITSTQDSRGVFNAIAQATITLLGAKMVRVWIDDPVGRALRLQESFGIDPDVERQMTEFPAIPYGRGAVGEIFESRVPEYIPDIQRDSRWQNERLAKEAGLHAYAGLPLITPTHSLGVLSILFGDRRHFTPEQKELTGLLADHAAIAIQNAQLLGELRIRQDRLESLLEVGRQLSRFQPVESLLGCIAEACRHLLGADAAGFRLVEGNDLVVVGTSGEAKEVMVTSRIKVGESLSGIVAATGEPLIVMDPGRDPRLIPAHAEADRQLRYRAFLGVPVKVGERVLGVLSMRTRRQQGFSSDDLAIAMPFGFQAAIALENARLFTESETRRRELAALQEAGMSLTSTLDLPAVLDAIVDSAVRLIGAQRCAVFELNPRDQRLHARATRGMRPDQPFMPMKLGQGAAGSAALRRQPVFSPDVHHQPLPKYDDVWEEAGTTLREVVRQRGYRAILAVPLISREAVLGAICIYWDRVHSCDEREIRLLTSVAHQAAVAVENARLYSRLQEQMSELRETQAQLLQASKLAAVGQLVGGVAHEINNPLAVIVCHAERLAQTSPDPQVGERAGKILAFAKRAARIIQELQSFVRPQPRQLANVHLPEVLEHTLRLREQTLRVSGIRVEQDIASGLPPVRGDSGQLEQVVLNLLLNAEQAVARNGEQGSLTIRLTAQGDRVRLAVADSGPGIPPDIVPRIFEPFFTTKPVGQGTGLGLSICYGIVQAHGGRIWAESEPGLGATVIVELPAHWAEGTVEALPAALPPLRRGHVLVVEDEDDVAEVFRELLESLGQEVTVAVGGEAGWERLKGPDAPYDVVTLDLKMPNLSGQKLWERLVAHGIPLVERVVFVTGDTADPETQRFLDQAGRPVLTKPLDEATFATLLAEWLAAS